MNARTLIALVCSSLSFACQVDTSYDASQDEICPVSTCTESTDTDADGALDCEDTDLDGDGLRNIWDAQPYDGKVAEVLPGGLATDGALDCTGVEVLSPEHTLLSGTASKGATTLQVEDSASFAEGDEILVLSVQGEGAGTRFFAFVADADQGVLSIEPPLDRDIAGDVILVQRVPHYTTATVRSGARLETGAWSEDGSGVLAFRSLGDVEIAGTVSAGGAGFSGARGERSDIGTPEQGESYDGAGGSVYDTFGDPNEGGGGAGYACDLDENATAAASGAGGAYGSDGEDGLWENDTLASAIGGSSYGDEELESWFLGSGGGAGSTDPGLDGSSEDISGGGGAGGGAVMIFSESSITVTGSIDADGARGEDASSVQAELGGGGGGAGGQIYLGAPTLNLDLRDNDESTISAVGGFGGSAASSTADGKTSELVCDREDTSTCTEGHGGEGGVGRIRFDLLSGPGTGITVPDPVVRTWGDPTRFPCDADGDGVRSVACGWSIPTQDDPNPSDPGEPVDCDDQNASVFPGATEIQGDGVDSDCDGADETCSTGELVVIHGG